MIMGCAGAAGSGRLAVEKNLMGDKMRTPSDSEEGHGVEEFNRATPAPDVGWQQIHLEDEAVSALTARLARVVGSLNGKRKMVGERRWAD
jgi:hypothetical protein